MRVIAGTARSITLAVPKGIKTRPTADRLKENLFNMLAPFIPGAVFLDIYSGSGAIGIEALSRGAASAVLVENSKTALEAIRTNLKKTRLDGSAKVMPLSAERAIQFLSKESGQFDIIFMDPPYEKGHIQQTLIRLANTSLLAQDGIIVAEMAVCEEPFITKELSLQKEKTYGDTKFVWYTR